MSASAKPLVAPMPASPQSNPPDLGETGFCTVTELTIALGTELVALAMSSLTWDVLT